MALQPFASVRRACTLALLLAFPIGACGTEAPREPAAAAAPPTPAVAATAVEPPAESATREREPAAAIETVAVADRSDEPAVTGRLSAPGPTRGSGRDGARRLAVRVDGTEAVLSLDDDALGVDGLPVAARATPVGGGTLVIVDHNLDLVVDPPRFDGSRWSELWWVGPGFVSGSALGWVPLEGEQFYQAFAMDDGSACVSDARGPLVRLSERDGVLMRAPPTGCPPRVAEQYETVFHRRGAADITDASDDDYLDIVEHTSLAERVWLVRALWIDGGQFLEEEGSWEAFRASRGRRSTRLVVIDAEGHVHWWYVSMDGHCTATSVTARGDHLSFACGEAAFDLERLELTRREP